MFRDVTQDMRIAREEIFGPVISAMPFDREDEVVKAANDTSYGLGSGIWTPLPWYPGDAGAPQTLHGNVITTTAKPYEIKTLRIDYGDGDNSIWTK